MWTLGLNSWTGTRVPSVHSQSILFRVQCTTLSSVFPFGVPFIKVLFVHFSLVLCHSLWVILWSWSTHKIFPVLNMIHVLIWVPWEADAGMEYKRSCRGMKSCLWGGTSEKKRGEVELGRGSFQTTV